MDQWNFTDFVHFHLMFVNATLIAVFVLFWPCLCLIPPLDIWMPFQSEYRRFDVDVTCVGKCVVILDEVCYADGTGTINTTSATTRPVELL